MNSYFTTEGIEPSPAEQMIMDVLDKYKVHYLREVSFKGFTSPKGGYYRYDFFLPQRNLVIEYDGQKYHRWKTNDTVKNLYCRNNGIHIVRLNNKHYFKLEYHLKKIIKAYKLDYAK